MRELFLAGADVVLAAVGSPAVADAWERPSILADQTVGSLAGHLARGAVWTVGEYLDRPLPDGTDGIHVDFESAAEYYASVTDSLTDADHEAIRARGASVAEAGRDGVVAHLSTAVVELRDRLSVEPADRTLGVYGGNVMRLDDYLVTRIVEEVVHLDDLARSLDVEPWPMPPGAEELVIACGVEIGRRRFGGRAMLRALFRDGAAATLPVL